MPHYRHDSPSTRFTNTSHLDLLQQVSHLDFYWVSEVSDGDVSNAAGHHVAVEGQAVLVFLETKTNVQQEVKNYDKHTCCLVFFKSLFPFNLFIQLYLFYFII